MPRVPSVRPGALQDLPLEYFVPTHPHPTGKIGAHANPYCKSPSMVSTSSTKRPAVSPIPLSTAKRRMLALEGAFSPDRNVPSGSRDTPGRKLEFGLTLDSIPDDDVDMGAPVPVPTEIGTPRRSKRVMKLAPSPDIVMKSPSKRSSKRAKSPSKRETSPLLQRGPLFTEVSHTPMMITRELPTLVDPQSPHYPGFDIYMDTHILLPSTRDAYSPSPSFGDEADACKENTPAPRRSSARSTLTGSPRQPMRMSSPLSSPPTTAPLPRRLAFGDASTETFSALGALMRQSGVEEPSKLPSFQELSPGWTPRPRRTEYNPFQDDI